VYIRARDIYLYNLNLLLDVYLTTALGVLLDRKPANIGDNRHMETLTQLRKFVSVSISLLSPILAVFLSRSTPSVVVK
jgi:hypothetical protein